jgi:hypothetical protein
LLETNFDSGTCLCVTYALCVNGSYSVCSANVPDGGVRVLADGAPVDSRLDVEADAPLDAASDTSADATDAGEDVGPDATSDISAPGDARGG